MTSKYLLPLVLASVVLACSREVVNADAPDGSTDGAPSAAAAPPEESAAAPSITWGAGPTFPTPRDHHASFIVDPGPTSSRFLYVAGGYAQTDDRVLSTVVRAHVGDEGALDAWQKVDDLPVPVSGAGVVTTHGMVVLAGGYGASTTWVASIQPDGSLGTFEAGPKLPAARFHPSAVAYRDFVYVVGGLAGSRTTDEVVRAKVDGSGGLGPWEVVARLPYSLSHHAAVIEGSTLVVIGGQTGNPNDNSGKPREEVQIAVLGDDGSVGPWSQGPSLPTAYSTHASLVYSGFVYVLGGVTSPGYEPTSSVLRARITAAGSLGEWTSDPSSALPSPRSHMHQVPVFRTSAYAISGRNEDGDEASVSIGAFTTRR